MSWAGKQHPIEMLLEWVAPLPLALAAAWAGKALGFSLGAAAAAAVAAFALGFLAIKRIGSANSPSSYGFEPTVFESAGDTDELLLGPQDEVLVLDDPLVEVPEDSRVVRLFARQEPTPGELVERIADFLGEDRRTVADVPVRVENAPPADASAALHTALANIRASLR